MAGDTKETSAVTLPDPPVDDPFPSIQRTLDGINDAVRAVADTIIRIDAGQRTSLAPRLRVAYLIVSRATAGDGILTVGTASYTFTMLAAPVRIDFPLVIERGTDIAFAGDGRIYLVGTTE
jgi:hypothetical protein